VINNFSKTRRVLYIVGFVVLFILIISIFVFTPINSKLTNLFTQLNPRSFTADISGTGSGTVVIFLTSGVTWTVPSDWNSSNNTIEVIGGGSNSDTGGNGGGGGAYAKSTNISLTPGATVNISVGGAGGDTWFNATSLSNAVSNGSSVSVGAQGSQGQTGGSASASVGTTAYSGGNGGSTGTGPSGGGGAGGPNGNGGNGGNGTYYYSGGGGGGDGGGGNGTVPNDYSGAPGGNNYFSSGRGTLGSSGTDGGGGSGSTYDGDGGNGGNGIEWATAGSGGGGGGGYHGDASSGGNGGNYGGGGGGYNGSGGQGIIVVTYTSSAGSNSQATSYTITAVANTGGSISPSGSVSVNSGSSQSFTLTTNSGYQLYSLNVDGQPVAISSSVYNFSNVTSSHYIQAVFSQIHTFYIDYSSGSNSNLGTEALPWKTHPYMQTSTDCTGGTTGWNGYVHQAGDKFIFKGGVTWPAACFMMDLQAGGTSSVQDYYGVDETWFSGSSWSRPVFDLQDTMTSDYRHSVILSPSYVTFDNFEIKNQLGGPSDNGDPSIDSAYNAVYNSTGLIVENGYVHGYKRPSDDVGPSKYGEGGVYGASLVQGMIFTDSDGGVIGQTPGSVPLMGCALNVQVFRNNTCDHYTQGVDGGSIVHDNTFSNGSAAEQDYTGAHTNDIQDTWQTGMTVYNNLIYNSTTGQHVAVTPAGKVFNNVMWNISGGSGTLIQFDTGIDQAMNYPGSVGYALNNTLAAGINPYDKRCIVTGARTGTTYGTVYIENNHCITEAPAFDSGSGGTQVQLTNVTMTYAQAVTAGYIPADKYVPTDSSNGTINTGTNLSSLCSGDMAALCSDVEGT